MSPTPDASPPRQAEPDASPRAADDLTGEPPPVSKAIPLTAADIAALLNAAERGSAMWRRNRALVAVFALCGLRMGEALGLDEADVNVGDGTLTIRTDDASRVMPVAPDALDALAAWIDERHSFTTRPAEGLFVTREGRRIAPGQARQLLSRLAQRAGVTAPVSPASLRRAHAGELLSRGWPLHEIQRRLGYGTLAATRRFLVAAGLPPAAESHLPVADGRAGGPGPCGTCLYGDARESDSALDLMEKTGDAVLAVDRDGTIRTANGLAEALFASTRPTIVGANLWDLLSGPRYSRIRQACHDCATTRRVVAEAEAGSAFGGRRALFRAIPTARGMVLWIRDDLTLDFMETFLRGCLELAHGDAPGTVALLRAMRDQTGEATDFMVVAAHGTRPTRVVIDPALSGKRLSDILPGDFFAQFVRRLIHSLETGEADRVVVQVPGGAPGDPSVAVRTVALGGEWLVLTARDL